MPTNKLIVPLINPVKFIRYTSEAIDKYRSRHFDDFFHMETIYPWQQRKFYVQPFQTTDRIKLQFRSQEELTIKIIDVDEAVYYTVAMTQGAADVDDPTLFIYECDIELTDFVNGLYFLQVQGTALDTDGNYMTLLISEPLEIKSEHKYSLLLNYSHYQYYNDFIFETGLQPQIRLRATLSLKALSSKDTLFEDQVLDMTMIQSKPFRIYTLKIGGATGIPDYLADLVNRILGCPTLYIDGKPYSKSEGAKMEDNGIDNYPLRGWQIDLREARNIASKDFSKGFWVWSDGGSMEWDDDSLIPLG